MTYTDFLILLEQNGVKIKYRENGCPDVFHPYDSINKRWKSNEEEPEFKDLLLTLSLLKIDYGEFEKVYEKMVHKSKSLSASAKLSTFEECIYLNDIYEWFKNYEILEFQ